MTRHLTMLLIGCGILTATPVVTTSVATKINWLKNKAIKAKFYCEKGFEPIKNLILFYLAVKYMARTSRKILEIEPYRDKRVEVNDIPGIKYIMPSNHDENLQIHYLKAIPLVIGSLGIIGYIRDKWEKRKEKRKSSNFFFTSSY